MENQIVQPDLYPLHPPGSSPAALVAASQPASAASHPASVRETTAVRAPAIAPLAGQLAAFEPSSLAGLDAVSLLDRIDTKFLLSEAQLGALLPALAADYRVLEIAGRRMHQYRTHYFDTPDFDLYRRHHLGDATRYKVRSRLYTDSGLAFFEIKAKDAEGRTFKHRLATERLLTDLSRGARSLLVAHAPTDDRALEPKLRNDFLRITLVGKHTSERVTFDLAVQFEHEGRTAALPRAIVAEVKQHARRDDSPFFARMRAAGRPATSVSKYCIGVALLVHGIERDAFDEKLRAFEDLRRDT